MRYNTPHWKGCLWGWVCLQEFRHAGGCILKGFDLQALTESFEVQCVCCDNGRTDPIGKDVFGCGCVSKSFDILCKLTCGVWRSICRV